MVGGISGFGRVMSTAVGSGRWLRAGRRRCAQLGLRRVAIALPVAAYNHAPTMDLFGSHFPAWVLCGAVGIVAAVIIRRRNRSRRPRRRSGMHCMPPARFPRVALAGCVLLGACNDTRDLAPASPDTPWQFEPSKEAPGAPAPSTVGARRFTVPENTAVPLPSPADIDPNRVYSLVELIDIAQRRNPATRVAWEQARQAAINVGIARAA